MDILLLVWALVATYYAFRFYRAATVSEFVSRCQVMAGILSVGAESYVRRYFLVLRNQPHGTTPIRRTYRVIRKTYGLAEPRYWYADIDKVEEMAIRHYKRLEPELVEQSKSYDD
jgi:hypothetical protein